MKKTFLILIAFLIGITAFAQQGSIPVPPGYGGEVEATHRQRVIDASGTYVANTAPHEIDHLFSYGLWNNRFTFLPDNYLAGSILNQIPTDGTADFTIARASVKTTVNEDGLLQEIANTVPSINFLIGEPYLESEPQRTNLEIRPVSFGHSDWTMNFITIGADPLSKGADQNVSSCANGDYTTFSGASATGFSATSDGAATHEAGCADEIVVTTLNIIRVAFTLVLNSGTAPTIALKDALAGSNIANAKTQVSTAGANVMYFFGSSATTGLVEFSNTSTATDFVVSLLSVSEVTGYSAPHADSPLNVSAFKLEEDGSNGIHEIDGANIAVTSGQQYAATVYAKADERTFLQLTFTIGGGSTFATFHANYNLETGVTSAFGGCTSTITPIIDGWYCCTITADAALATTNSSLIIIPSLAIDQTRRLTTQGILGSGIKIAFAQFENGTYPTSWIYDGTEGSSTTRQADEVNNAGVAATFNSEAGYLYMESAALFDDLSDRYISISDGSVANAVQLYYSSTTNQIVGKIIVGSATQATLTYTLSDEIVFSKALVSWAANDFTLVVNGVERATDVSGSVPVAGVLDEISLDDGNAGNDFYGKLKSIQHGNAISAAKRVSLTTID